MPVSGLVVTLSSDPELRRFALASMSRHPALEVGSVSGHRVPVVVETSAGDDDRAVWDWLHTLSGVRFVDVAFLHFDEAQQTS